MLKPSSDRGINRKGHLRRTLIAGICLGLVLVSFHCCFPILGLLPWRYEAEPIVGRVIDDETGEPIAGVAVVALWLLARPIDQGGTEWFEVIETETDEEGVYGIEGWGPRWRPWFYRLTDSDPELVIFKPGYLPKTLLNDIGPNELTNFNPSDAKIREAYWHGKDIRLRSFKIGLEMEKQREDPTRHPSRGSKVLTLEEWADRISRTQSGVDWHELIFRGREEDWLKIKNFVRMIYQECMKLPSNGPTGNLRNRIKRIPQKYHEVLLEDQPPCP